MHVPAALLPLVLHLDDINQKPPADNDVVAGWIAFLVFLGLAAGVAFLGWSLTRQFRKVREAREAGVFDDPEEQTDKREPETEDRDDRAAPTS